MSEARKTLAFEATRLGANGRITDEDMRQFLFPLLQMCGIEQVVRGLSLAVSEIAGLTSDLDIYSAWDRFAIEMDIMGDSANALPAVPHYPYRA